MKIMLTLIQITVTTSRHKPFEKVMLLESLSRERSKSETFIILVGGFHYFERKEKRYFKQKKLRETKNNTEWDEEIRISKEEYEE